MDIRALSVASLILLVIRFAGTEDVKIMGLMEVMSQILLRRS